MISFLEGKIVFVGKGFVILEVQGVGYKVFVTEKTILTLPKTGNQLKLYTHLYLREESAELYGFLSPEECELFETLNNISGIGPRTALALSSFASLSRLKEVMEKRPESLSRELKGIGKKKTQKILLELTGKIKEITFDQKRTLQKEQDDALDALLALGIPKHKARSALSEVPREITETGERVKEALRILGK